MKTTTTTLKFLYGIILFAFWSNGIYSQSVRNIDSHHHSAQEVKAAESKINYFFSQSNFGSEQAFVKSVFKDNQKQAEFLKKYYSKIDLDKSILMDLVYDNKINQVSFNKFLLSKQVEYRTLFVSFLEEQSVDQLSAGSKGPTLRGPGDPCQNMDFESQTLNGWVGSYGSSDADPSLIAGFDNPGINSGTGQHVIMTGGTDPNVAAIPCVMPGGTASLRLGDDGGGWNRAARISQTFMVQAANPYFTYNYAVVLEDAGHVLAEQPYFRIRMYDGSNNLISCATLDVDATNAPGLISTAALKYKNWTQVVIPLTTYIGQNVTIEFSTADCNNGAPSGGSHDGYAYIDCSCVPPQIFTSSPTICGGQTINVTAPSGLSSYSWSGPGIVGANNTQTIAVNQPGTYTVSMQTNTTPPNAPCTFTLDTIIPGNPSNPVAQFTSNTVCLGAATQFTDQSTPVGSITAWAWDFDNNGSTDAVAQNPTHVFPGSGTFPVTLTITWGACTDNFTANVTVNPGVAPVINPAGPYCENAAPVVLTAAAAGGTWSGTGITNAATGAFDPALATLGNNTITYTITGACGSSDTEVIVVNAVPTSAAGSDVTICTGSTGNIGTATTAGYSYSWSPTTGLSSPTISNPTVTLTNVSALPVTTTYTVTTTSSGCTSTDVVDVIVNPLAMANAGPPLTICTGTTALLSGAVGGAATSGTWGGGAGTFSPNNNTLNAVYTPSAAEEAAGSVTLTLVSNDPAGPCPVATSTVTITINPLATINAGADQTTCIGGTITLAGIVGGGATTGTWSGGAGTFAPNATTANAVYTPSAAEEVAGTVTLTYTSDDPAGPCASVNDQMVITITQLPTVSAGLDQTICNGSTATLSGTIGGAATSATWTGGTGTFAPNNTALNAIYTPSAAELAAGTVTLTLTTNDPNGPCVAVTDQMTITINPIATINAGVDQTICIGSTVTLAGIPGGSATSGTWSGGTGTFAPNNTAANAVYTPSAAEAAVGTVTLTFTSDDPIGPCPSVTDQMVITINALPTVNAGTTQAVCSGASITLVGSVGGSATSGTWTGGTGTFVPNNTTLNAVYTPSAAEYAAGTVTLTLTTNDPAGPCNAVSATVTHNFFQNPVVNFAVDVPSGCPIHCVQFTDLSVVGGGDNIASWSWNFGDNSPVDVTQNPAHCYSNTGFYDVSLTATSNNGCATTLTIAQMIQVFAMPVAEFTSTPNPASVLDPTVTLINQSSSDVNYWDWTFGDGDSLNNTFTPNPIHIYPNVTEGIYNATLIVQNSDGCWDTVVHPIVIGPEFTFYIPNAFTPNGDNVNDTFFGQGIGIVEYDIWIFDRWGNMIFHGDDLGDVWDGRANNGSDVAQQDVYVWKVKLTDVFGKKHNYLGTVTLVK
jgi:gliding motility-associated-like protein